MTTIKELDSLTHFIKYELLDELEQAIELTDLEEIGENLLTRFDESMDNDSLKNNLETYIHILNFIEYETSIETTVSDDLYDRIVEKYKDLGGTRSIGLQENKNSTKKFGYHKYPELRGSLDKIHYIKTSDIPQKDSRKSFQQFLSGVIRELNANDVKLNNEFTVAVDFKWDGLSHVLEMSRGELDRVLTRYDVDNNIGVDITHVFRNYDIHRLFFTPLPSRIGESNEVGLKVETFMPTNDLNRYMIDMRDRKCNRRSAVTSIVNRGEDEVDPSLLQYIALKPLEIASSDYIELTDDDHGWIYLGTNSFGRHHYIHIYTLDLAFKVNDINHFLNNLDLYPLKDAIEAEKSIAGEIIPIDGAVITLLDKNIVSTMGRSGNKNKFQIAFKFPQGIKKTILTDVEFPVGPTAGTITPLAIVKPVMINGATITNASLSNFDKLERLDLNIGDEVIIKYDIIPKLEKDDTCIKGTGPKIIRLTYCPVCHSDLKGGARCLNPDCDAKLAGKIYNYVKKMKIRGIGKKTITRFVSDGFLTCIGDLYRLSQHMNTIVNMPGFGVSSFAAIMEGIYAETKKFPHELLGSIGIPDVSVKTMKKVCEKMDIISMTKDQLIESSDEMTNIQDIGHITANKIVDGMVSRMDVIEDVAKYMDFKEYPKEKIKPDEIVLFTECRHKDFAEYLESINVEVASSYVKALTLLIIPDDLNIETSKNVKVARAKKESLPIITLSEAFKKFNFPN